MKYKDIKKMSDEALKKLLINLIEQGVKASSVWGRDKVDSHKIGMARTGKTNRGVNTSIQKNIRRTIAKVKTELRRRELENEK